MLSLRATQSKVDRLTGFQHESSEPGWHSVPFTFSSYFSLVTFSGSRIALMIINKTHIGLSFASWVKAVPLCLIFGLVVSELDVNKFNALSCFLQGANHHDWLFRLINTRFIIPLIVFWFRQPVLDNVSNHTIKYCKDQEKKTKAKWHTGPGTFERKTNEDQSNGECTNWK